MKSNWFFCAKYRFFLIFLFCSSKKIENMGKISLMTQEEIMTNTKTIVQGLEALKNEHNALILGIVSNLEHQSSPGETIVLQEKKSLVERSVDNIELGLGEAQVCVCLILWFGKYCSFVKFNFSFLQENLIRKFLLKRK